MAGDLTAGALARLARTGIGVHTPAEGLALLEAADATGLAHLMPARLALDAGATAASPMLRDLIVAPVRRTAALAIATGAPTADSLVRRLAGMSVGERRHVLVELVRGLAAWTLGHASAAAVAEDRPFKEAGFDSLTSVELHNRLSVEVGRPLSATLVFDHPTPGEVADYLLAELAPAGPTEPSIMVDLDEWRHRIMAAANEPRTRDRLVTSLEEMMSELHAMATANDVGSSLGATLETATDEEIFTLIDNELGVL
jgi:hypothetical protein